MSALPALSNVHYAVAFRVGHLVGENRGARFSACRACEQLRQAVAVEDVVAKDQRAAVAPHKIAPMMKACANPSGRGCAAR